MITIPNELLPDVPPPSIWKFHAGTQRCSMKTHPHFTVDVTLYPAEQGGRREPIAREGFGCPCKLDEKSDTAADCRLYLGGQQIAPGETKRVGIRFSYEAAAPLFRAAGRFYLWDGRIIGEARVVPS